MLPSWGWVLLWAVLVLGGGVLVGLRVRDAWRSARALAAEVGRATRTLEALETHGERMRAETEGVTAVTQDPHSVREQYRTQREQQRSARLARRSRRMPRWARVQ
ncbi:hypothetical protein [Phycicoccus flavus]|uniref:hypothetical protein n=1 Tax=Phycicoccus flavus TaxID=2502783 RepID=UPI000FEBFC83|nr:hypothetical protein [Phycicoccus flavus]NHA68353.1 hypothetical protein [Phycicoccus flavus]